MKDHEIINRLRLRLKSVRRNWPDSDGMMAALTEETGELARAMLTESRDRQIDEAIDVCVCAIRLATEGDPTLAMLNPRAVRQGEDA